jgi:hypothetical protein
MSKTFLFALQSEGSYEPTVLLWNEFKPSLN